MALNGPALGAAIKAQLLADGNAIDSPEMAAVWDSIGTAVVAYLVTNTVVATTVAPGIVLTTPDTINGATTGPGIGTGTIS